MDQRQKIRSVVTADATDSIARTWGPSGNEGDGIILHSMSDCSIRKVRDDVEPHIYFAAITINGGEITAAVGKEPSIAPPY